MVEATDLLQTKLDKVKSFMDNGSFVFIFTKTKPFAIHEDQLFKNQMRDESINEFGIPGHVPYLSEDFKPETFKKIDGILDSYYGILLDSGRLLIPIWKTNPYNNSGTHPNSVSYGYFAIETKQESYNRDIIIDFVIHNHYVYILTLKNELYRINLLDNQFDTYITDKKYKNNDGTTLIGGTVTLKDTFKLTLQKTIVNGSETTHITEERKKIKLFKGATKIYVLLASNILYAFEHTNTLPSNNICEIVYQGDEFKKIVNITHYHNKTYFMFQHGKVKCIGDSSLGLGNGKNKGIVTELTPIGSDMNPDHYANQIQYLQFRQIKDVAIGASHTIFVMNDGTCVGYGKNNQYQLGDEDASKEFIDTYKHISFKNEFIIKAKCTKYGSIFLTKSGKLLYCGTFLHGELGIYTENAPIYGIKPITHEIDFDNMVSDSIVLTIPGETPTKEFLIGKTVRRISNHYIYENSNRVLKPTYMCDLINIPSDSGVIVIKEDHLGYYTGKDRDIVGLTNDRDVDMWTPIESSIKSLNRTIVKRPFMWNYYENYVMKMNGATQNQLVSIYYKNHNGVWIDWINYINEYIRLQTLEFEGVKYPKCHIITHEGDIKRSVLNFKSYGILASKPSVELKHKVSRIQIPECLYIDKDLNTWNINKGDNIYLRIYTHDDYINDTKTHDERLAISQELVLKYDNAIATETNPTIIAELQEKKETELKLQELLNAEKDKIRSRIGKVAFQENLQFTRPLIFNPLKVIGTEKKNITYTHTVIDEPVYNESGLQATPLKVRTQIIGGIETVVKESTTIETNVLKTRVSYDFVDYRNVLGISSGPSDANERDLRITLHPDEGETVLPSIDDYLIWIDGAFVTKDFYEKLQPGETIRNKFITYDILSRLNTRRICEYPGYGPPPISEDAVPRRKATNATVIEPTAPTELRYNLDTKLFGWEGIKIDGPYTIYDHIGTDTNNNCLRTNLVNEQYFYFGDLYVSFFNDVRFIDRKLEKGTFILFMDGAIIPESEYDIYERDGMSYLSLKPFYDYLVNSLMEFVNTDYPGYKGFVKRFLKEYKDFKHFSIAFLNTEEKYKKVKIYYDRQIIRNFPKPGQVTFRDIGYNDLITFDGWYIPYLWESQHCIRVPYTVRSRFSAINDYIEHSDIYRVRPYITYKEEHQMSDSEISEYAIERNIIEPNQLTTLPMYEIRKLVREHLKTFEID